MMDVRRLTEGHGRRCGHALGAVALALAFLGNARLAAGEPIQVTGIAAEGRRIDPHMVGYNSDYYYVTDPWSSDARRAAAAKARPSMLRYPGGTSASYWDAYRSRMFRDVPAIDPADGNPAAWTRTRYTINWVHNAHFWLNVAPLADLKRLHEELDRKNDGAGTVFVANMVTPGPDFYTLKRAGALDRAAGSDDWWGMLASRYGAFEHMLSEAEKAGIPVEYVELGNEYYFGAGLTHDGQPADVEPYVAGAYDADRSFAYEDVGAFPDQAGGKDVLYLYSVAANDWAAKVKRAHPQARVCAVGAFVDQDGLPRRMANWNQEALAALDPKRVEAVSLHLYGGPQQGSLTDDERRLGQALKSWRDFWIAGAKRSRWPAAADLWITEFNIDDEFGEKDALPPSRGTWGNGLGNLYCLHHWLASEPRVQVVLLHELARVILGDGPEIKANGRAYGLFAHACAGRTRAAAIAFDGIAPLDGSDGELPGIVGWRFDAPDAGKAPRYAIVNFSGTPRTLAGLSPLLGTAGGHFLQAAATLDALADPGETAGAVSESLTLPAFSVTVVEPSPPTPT